VPSTFTWLDHSEVERQKVLDVIDLFRERDTRDELGIGQIRDVFSNLLFPGTSTIQTRAAYFLFLPWIYLDLERRRIPVQSIRQRGRSDEITLIAPLMRNEDYAGTIGGEAGAALQRLASSVYWGGLGTWGIRRFPGSRDQYHRSLDGFYRVLDQRKRDGGEAGEGLRPRNWHAGVPDPPAGFPREASFQLRKEDAQYLRERILLEVGDSMLAFLVDETDASSVVAFPWLHPDVHRLPASVATILEHARCFSETMHGAALLYNLMLAEKAERRDLIDAYQSRLGDWATEADDRATQLANWDRAEFWDLVLAHQARLPFPTRRFVDQWLDLVLASLGSGVTVNSQVSRQLIENREHQLKRGRSRLFNQRALEMWNEAAGMQRLEYRWPVVQQIVRDIVRSL
jgi:uncharacterized protein DUF6361